VTEQIIQSQGETKLPIFREFTEDDSWAEPQKVEKEIRPCDFTKKRKEHCVEGRPGKKTEKRLEKKKRWDVIKDVSRWESTEWSGGKEKF